MRIILDTPILIPGEMPDPGLAESFARIVRMAREYGHVLVYHPASEDELRRDWSTERRRQNLESIKQFTRLDTRPSCPWVSPYTRPDEAVDNELLYALHCDLAHALVAEDRALLDTARARGLADRVFTIQTAEDWLCRLYDRRRMQLPPIEDIGLDTLEPRLAGALAQGGCDWRPPIEEWISEQARPGGRAWVSRERGGDASAICLYAQADDGLIVEEGSRLGGPMLKLSPFMIAPSFRSRKIGELFLDAAFRYATANRLENIVMQGDADAHRQLFVMLEDFGFSRVGSRSGPRGREAVYVKSHPVLPPADALEPLEYLRRFFPHFRHDPEVGKLVLSVRPGEHRLLFPDYHPPSGRQLSLFSHSGMPSHTIKSAWLCHARFGKVRAGDVVLFFRSGDERAVTSIGVVERFDTLDDADLIAGCMKRRTTYLMKEIVEMARKPTRVLLFRLIGHLPRPLSQSRLEADGVLSGAPQRISQIAHEAFERLMAG